MRDLGKSTAESVYVAGPMAGYEDFNHPMFNAVSAELRIIGLKVINPAELDAEDLGADANPDNEDAWSVEPKSRAAYMKRDLPYVAQCDAIALLPGWEASIGANIELITALAVGNEVWEFVDDIDGNLVLTYSEARPDIYAIVQHIEETHA